jgi:hypothetical protein
MAGILGTVGRLALNANVTENAGAAPMFEWLKKLFKSKPPAQFHHPNLGLMTEMDPGLWSGRIEHAGREIEFVLSGSEMVPDAGLTARLQEALRRIDAIEQSALDFLCTQKTLFKPGDFTFQSINFLWEKKPDVFTLEFSMAGDEHGIWRVEFENDQPRHIGRDD